jgi:predicted GIY-YIG superfamily endonuclease
VDATGRFISRDKRLGAPHLEASVKRYRRIVKDYSVHRLVFVEFHNTTEPAILRKKRLKKWWRAWKLELIERHNPDWCDLYDELAL